jgi:hypothetical protein
MNQYFTKQLANNKPLLMFFDQAQVVDGVPTYGPGWILELKSVAVDDILTISETYSFVRMAGDFPVFTRKQTCESN